MHFFHRMKTGDSAQFIVMKQGNVRHTVAGALLAHRLHEGGAILQGLNMIQPWQPLAQMRAIGLGQIIEPLAMRRAERFQGNIIGEFNSHYGHPNC